MFWIRGGAMPEGLTLVLTPAALPMFAVAILIFLVGCFAAVSDPRSRVTLSFALMTLCASIWLLSTSILMMSTSAEAASVWARLTYIGVCALPAAVLQFSLALGDEWDARRGALACTWAISAVFIALFTTTDLFITGVLRYDWGYYTRLGAPAVVFLLFFASALLASLFALRRALHGYASQQQKKRAGAFLLALAVGYLATIDYLPSFGVAIYPVGYIAALGFVTISVIAIRRYHLVDLNPSFVADQLLDTVNGGVLVVDMLGIIRVANPAAERLLAASSPQLIGHDLRGVLRAATLPATDSHTFARSGRMLNRRMTWRRCDGNVVDLSVSATMLRDRDRLPVGILYVMHDLSERRRAERSEFAANHDPLTGLPNRVYFAKRFEQTRGEIESAGRVAGVMFLDLDGFKEINDRHGHTVGDRLLEIVATRLRNALREEDVVARYGGDEFVVLVSLRSAEDAEIVSHKLERVVREPVAFDDATVHVGTSIGVAISRAGADLDDLIRDADEAMYRDKRRRRPAATTTRPGIVAAADVRV